jgi:hypothetical protein
MVPGCCGVYTLRCGTMNGLGAMGVPSDANLPSPLELDRRSKQIF